MGSLLALVCPCFSKNVIDAKLWVETFWTLCTILPHAASCSTLFNFLTQLFKLQIVNISHGNFFTHIRLTSSTDMLFLSSLTAFLTLSSNCIHLSGISSPMYGSFFITSIIFIFRSEIWRKESLIKHTLTFSESQIHNTCSPKHILRKKPALKKDLTCT